MTHDFHPECRRALGELRSIVEMPDAQIDRYIGYVLKNHGSLSKSKRKKEFAELTNDEVRAMEAAVREAFEMQEPAGEFNPAPYAK